MGEARFTPGPWCVVIDDDGNPLSGRPSIMASDELDCGIIHWDGFVQPYWRSARGDKEIHANAHLIAAAPDLYAALKEVAERLHNCAANIEEEYPIWASDLRKMADNAAAALAKAEGKT